MTIIPFDRRSESSSETNQTHETLTPTVISGETIKEVAWELYAGFGLRTASAICSELANREYGDVPRTTVQSWITRGQWRDKLHAENTERFPHLMREIAGDLMRSGAYAAARLLQAESTNETLDRDRREQIRMTLDHAGFSPVGQMVGITNARGETEQALGSIGRWLNEHEREVLRETGHLPALVAGHDESPA